MADPVTIKENTLPAASIPVTGAALVRLVQGGASVSTPAENLPVSTAMATALSGKVSTNAIGVTVQPFSQVLTDFAGAGGYTASGDGITLTGYQFSLSDQALALNNVTTAANKLIYATGAAEFATTDLTSVARALIGQTTQALMRTTGLGLSANGSSLVTADYAGMRTQLGLVIGTDVQAYDADLQALANNTGNGLWARTGAGTGAARTLTGTANEVAVANGDGVSGNPTVSLPSSITLTGKTLTGGNYAGVGSIGMTGAVTLSGDPVNPLEAAPKQYVDAVAQGLNVKASALVATTANITLSGEQTIDGILTSASRVLVKNQSTPAQNGIYVSAAGPWARSVDMDTWAEVPSAFVFVSSGTVNGDTGWVCTSDAGGTLGTTPITWTQFSGAGTYTAGTGLVLTGTQFALTGQALALNNVGTAADQLIYATGVGTFSTTGFTSVARTLVSQTTQALMRTTGLGMSANGSSLVSAADYAAMKVLLAISASDLTNGVVGTGAVVLASALSGVSGIIATEGPPTDGEGSDGGFSVDTVNRNLYGPKAAGTWVPDVWRNIATAGTVPDNIGVADEKVMSVAARFTLVDLDEIRLIYPNFWLTSAGDTGSGTGSLDITFSIAYPNKSTVIGTGTLTISASAQGEFAVTGTTSLSATIPAGAQFWVATYGSPAAGTAVPSEGVNVFGLDTGVANTALGEAVRRGAAETDQTANPSAVTNQPTVHMYSPCAVLALVPATQPSAIILGDSIARGYQGGGYSNAYDPYNNQGWIQWGLSNQVPSINYSRGAMLTAGYITNGSVGQALALAAGCTHAVMETGIVDLAQGVTPTQLIENYDDLWGIWADLGMNVIQTTLLPRTKSSDNWLSVEAQGSDMNTPTPALQTVNNYVRNCPAPLIGCIESSDMVTAWRDSNIWYPSLHLTSDGTHLGNAALPVLAKSVDLTIFEAGYVPLGGKDRRGVQGLAAISAKPAPPLPNARSRIIVSAGTWTAGTTPADNQWDAVAYSPLSGRLVAVANSGTGDRAMYSDDGGATWTIAVSAADNQWRGLCWSGGRGLFVAVAASGTGNRVMTSPDGITWTAQTSAADNGWQSVAWSPELGMFAACATTGTNNRIMTSFDGVSWVTRTTPGADGLNAITWAPELGLFVAVGASGTDGRVLTSPDGVTWTSRTASAALGWASVSWSPQLGILVSSGVTSGAGMYSRDGITWTATTMPAGNWYSMPWSPEAGLFAAVSTTGTLCTSPDGINWTSRTAPDAYDRRSMVWAPAWRRFVAVSQAGTGDRAMYSATP